VSQSTQSQVMTNLECTEAPNMIWSTLARQRGSSMGKSLTDDPPLGQAERWNARLRSPGRMACAGKVGAVLCFDEYRLALKRSRWASTLGSMWACRSRVIDLDGVYTSVSTKLIGCSWHERYDPAKTKAIWIERGARVQAAAALLCCGLPSNSMGAERRLCWRGDLEAAASMAAARLADASFILQVRAGYIRRRNMGRRHLKRRRSNFLFRPPHRATLVRKRVRPNRPFRSGRF